MPSYIVEIHPQKPAFDPQAHRVRTELLEEGVDAASAVVQTCRLYKLEGELTPDQAEKAAEVLLVDPVVERAVVEYEKTKEPRRAGVMLDVWPKPGVTDPVGETVEKGLRDLGFRGAVRASSAHRYIFPKIKDARPIEKLARRFLANELVHVIRLRKN